MTHTCLGKWLHTFVSVYHVPVCVYMCVGALHDWKVASGPLELELTGTCEMPRVGAGNHTQAFSKDSLFP